MGKSNVNIRDLRAKPNRNVFDLSKRIESSAPFGMIVPTFVKHVIPGSKFEISLENQTTARPLVTRAFARIREHFDYFFVPLSQLYKPFENFITMQANYHSKAISDVIGGFAPPLVPFVNGQTIQSLWATGRTDVDIAGYPMYLGNQRIAEYLGYGLYDYNRNYTNFPRALRFNLFNALAYQKIYADFYRNDYYEGYYTDHFNVDDLSGDVSLNGTSPINGGRLYKIFEPHYRLKKKDYFTIVTPDILPSPSILPFAGWNSMKTFEKLSSDGGFVQFNIPGGAASQGNQEELGYVRSSSDSTASSGFPFGSDVNFNSNKLNYLSQAYHKFAAAREAYLKRVFAARNNYNSEMNAIFGYSPDTQRTDRVYHLGGYSQALSIDGINNTSDSGSNAQLPTGQVNFYLDQNRKIHFQCKEHGILMCLYSTSCENDYRPNRVVRDNIRNIPEDFFIPQYENIGKQALYQFEYDLHIDSTDTDYQKKILGIKGFVPRYSDYKMSVDEVHGALATSSYEFFSVFKNENDTLGSAFNITDLIENPLYVRNLFAGGLYDGSPASDHFLLNQYHKIKMIAPMQTISNF